MKVDFYTKLMLTVIAVALWVIVLKPIFISDRAVASSQVLDINIKEVAGKRVSNFLDINIEEINGRAIHSNALPVEIKK